MFRSCLCFFGVSLVLVAPGLGPAALVHVRLHGSTLGLLGVTDDLMRLLAVADGTDARETKKMHIIYFMYNYVRFI